MIRPGQLNDASTRDPVGEKAPVRDRHEITSPVHDDGGGRDRGQSWAYVDPQQRVDKTTSHPGDTAERSNVANARRTTGLEMLGAIQSAVRPSPQ